MFLQLGILRHREKLRNGKADRKREVESGRQKEHKPSGIILIHTRKIYIHSASMYSEVKYIQKKNKPSLALDK